MDKREKGVSFADDVMEKGYQELKESDHPEDKRLLSALRKVREVVLAAYRFGTRVPEDEVPKVYTLLMEGRKLWKLAVPGIGTVLYTVEDDVIRIVDIT